MYKNITSSGAQTVYANPTGNVAIQVNTGFTGTLTVTDGTTTVATITNPATGQFYQYFDLKASVIVNPSTTCDLTVFANGGRRVG